MAAIVIENKRQPAENHINKHLYWERNGIYWERHPLLCGDFIKGNKQMLNVFSKKTIKGTDVKEMKFFGTYNAAVNTKKNILEISESIFGKQKEYFQKECILAKRNGMKLNFLIENEDGVTSVENLFHWANPRLGRYNKIAYMHQVGRCLNVPLPQMKPIAGNVLAKAMLAMQKRYGVTFWFCTPEESGEKILELLEADYGK